MRIGVVCEGQTDFIAIKYFFTKALDSEKITASFIQIQPNIDCTTSDGGWGNVLLWLKNNPPLYRRHRYLGSGLFENNLSTNLCDLILIQMDSDILDDESFKKYVEKEICMKLTMVTEPEQRGLQIKNILFQFSKSQLHDHQYVFCPTVESSETWCIAAFRYYQNINLESLKNQQLWDEFGKCLDIFLNQNPKEQYSAPNKDQNRREQYCSKHNDHKKIKKQCRHFELAINQIIISHQKIKTSSP